MSAETSHDPSFRELLSSVKKSAFLLLGFVATLWVLEIIDQILLFEGLDRFGILPRRESGLLGILFWPFLHGGFPHLIANSGALIPLGIMLLLRGRGDFFWATFFPWVVGGALVWCFGSLFGPLAVHIGASGVIFGWLGFLLSRGLFDKSLKGILISVAVGVLYGGSVAGVLPGQEGISWEAHLFGFVSGVLGALVAAKIDRRRAEGTEPTAL